MKNCIQTFWEDLEERKVEDFFQQVREEFEESRVSKGKQ